MNFTEKDRSHIFIVLLQACIIGAFMHTALITALAPIMQDLSLDAGTVQWLVSSFTLVQGITILTTPFLIKRLPCRLLFATSMAAFSIGLLLSALSPSFTILLVGRIFQAAAIGVLTSLAQVMILISYPAEKRGSIMGVFGLAVGVAPVLAPTLSGIVVDLFGWRMIFLGTLIYSLVVFVSGSVFMKNISKLEEDVSFDTPSLALCSIGFTGIVVGMGNWGANNLIGFAVMLPVAVGFGAMFLFVRRQLVISKPFLNMTVFSNREFCVAVIASMIMFCGMIATSTLLPLYIQHMRGFNATISGLITMPGALLIALISPVAGKIYDKVGILKLYLVGSGFLILGNIVLIFLDGTTTILAIIGMFSFRQIGIGLLLMPVFTWGMSTLDVKYTSDGTAVLTSLRTVAGAIGSALFVSIMVAATTGDTVLEMIRGLNVAFIGIAVLTLGMPLIILIPFGRGRQYLGKTIH